MTDTELVALRDDVNRDSIIKQRAPHLWRPKDEARLQANRTLLTKEELRRWVLVKSPV